MAGITFAELQQQVTEAIIARAQSGEKIEWVRPWTGTGPAFESSYASGKPYRGVNQMWLALTAMANGYSSGYWITFNAAKKAGGSVRKGERSTVIFKARPYTAIDKETGKEEQRMFFGVDRVFNVDQCDGVEAPTVEPVVVRPELERIDAAEAVFTDYVAASGITFQEGGGRAFYRPSDDLVVLPPFDSFRSAEGYYATAFHEAAHSTGHATRQARDMSGGFGTSKYALEEVTAEVAAAIVCASIGMPDSNQTQHAGYVQSWLKATTDNAAALTKAITAGWKASDLVLGANAPTYVNRYDSAKAAA